MYPVLSIIIPTYKRNDLLSACLAQLTPQFQNLAQDLFEVIVTDDFKDNASRELKNLFPGVNWINGPGKGPAANRNNGAQSASGTWLVFIDDDCLPSAGLLNNYLIAISENPLKKVFEGCIEADRKQESFIEESPINETGGFLWSCNFMILKSFFLDSLKGFDENFPFAAMEDVDLHYRILKSGNEPLFLKEALVIHPWRKQKHMFSITLKRFKSFEYFVSKYPEKKKELNSIFYLRAFYNGLIRNTFSNAVKFKFRGFMPKLVYDSLQLFFAIKLLIPKRKA